MLFNELNIKDLNYIRPNTGTNLNALSDIEQKEYFELYNAYRKLLSEVFIKRFNLKELDDTFLNSDLCFVPNNPKKMDCYQWFSSNELKYFYLRNNVYVERLSSDEKEFLKKITSSNDFSITEDVERFVDNTYFNVIREDVKEYVNNNKEKYVLFGPDSKNYLVPNNSVVIGFNYDEFAENGLNDDEWYDRHVKQIAFICNTLNANIEKYNKNSKLPVNILKYNEFSIIKRK